jgi:hypothetical protein
MEKISSEKYDWTPVEEKDHIYLRMWQSSKRPLGLLWGHPDGFWSFGTESSSHVASFLCLSEFLYRQAIAQM